MPDIYVDQNGLGKMGSAALERFLKSERIKVIGIADPRPSIADGYNLAKANDIEVQDNIERFDIPVGTILVDFVDAKSAESTRNASRYVVDNGGKILIGTTPLPADIKNEILNYADKTAVLVHPNYAVNVNEWLVEMRGVADHTDPSNSITMLERHRDEKTSAAGTIQEVAKYFCQKLDKKGYIATILNKVVAFDPYGKSIEVPVSTTTEEQSQIAKDYIPVTCERFDDEEGLLSTRIGNKNNWKYNEVRATRSAYADGVELGTLYVAATKKGVVDFQKHVLRL